MRKKCILWIAIFLAAGTPGCTISGRAAPARPPAETAEASPSTEPTLTEIETPTKTGTPTSTFTPTATITLTPLPIPRMITVFATEGGVYLVKPPSEPVPLDSTIHPIDVFLSDDGSTAVYSSDDPPGFGIPNALGLISLDGGGSHSLLSKAQLGRFEEAAMSMHVQWIPRTHRMLFSTTIYDQRWGLMSANDLYAIDADTGYASRIFAAGAGGAAIPSPDGTRMAIAQCETIFLATIQGRKIFSNLIPFVNFKGYCFTPRLFWTSDSSRIGAIVPSYPEHYSIWLINVSTGAASILGTIQQYYSGEISPSLEYVVYSRQDEYSYNNGTYSSSYDVTISKVDGSGSKLLAAGASGIISFSPDGQHFAYYTDSPPLSGGSYCVDGLPLQKIYIGSPNGESHLIPGKNRSYLFQWINNSQFVFSNGKTLQLGDINGSSIPLAVSDDCMGPFDAKDLDFQAEEM